MGKLCPVDCYPISLSARNKQVEATEATIAEVSAAISSVSQGAVQFDTPRLQAKLCSKQQEARAVQKRLEEKQAQIKLLEDNCSELNVTLQDTKTKVEAAKAAAQGLDQDYVSLTNTLAEQEIRSTSLRELLEDAKQRNTKLRVMKTSKTKRYTKLQAKLLRQRGTLRKRTSKLTAELHEAESLSRVLGEGIQYGTERACELDEAKATSDDQRQQMEFKLRQQELNWQQQYAVDDAKFEAEVAAWNEKIKRVEQRLQCL